jgi:hypothetical protein
VWGVFVGGGGSMKEMKVREYGWWASYKYIKQNDETSCNCIKLGGDEVAGGDGGAI